MALLSARSRPAGGRRSLAGLAAGLLAVTGCGAPAGMVDVEQAARKACDVPSPAKPTTVNVLAYSGPAIDPFTDAIVKGCGGVRNLEIKHLPVDFSGQIQKAALALSSGDSSPYDLIESYNGTLYEYASKGWIRPLDGYIAKYKDRYGLGDIDPKAWDGFTYQGKIYGIPDQANAGILIYRKDLFSKLGLKAPRTYAEMLDAAKRLKAAKAVKYPLGMVWGSDDALADGFHSWLTANGGRWFDDTGRPAFDSPAGLKALQQMKGMLPYMPSGSLAFGNGDVMALMQQGLIGMTRIWASRAQPIGDPNQSRVAGKIGFAAAPAAVPGGPPASETSQDGFVIPKNSRLDPETLFRLMASTITSPDVMKQAATVAVPPRMSMINDPATARPYWPAVRESGERGVQPLPRVPYMDPLTKSVVNPYLAKALTGSTDPARALRAAATQLESSLKAKGYLR
ncbi:extracellular solute-binding protein [Actinomadura darangshiensis]|uniref:Extracellular solute-binding protein n=1 Tax=Actinomadura darangshiensis TaxID=705336 RepID=A0A4R5BRV8_9ACTN|nr:extracellular solute-binding protein [Actinomadura darangshiensis]TDD86852.1 extracellular solute-binding protein [Actinomadura darangshiensis]